MQATLAKVSAQYDQPSHNSVDASLDHVSPLAKQLALLKAFSALIQCICLQLGRLGFIIAAGF